MRIVHFSDWHARWQDLPPADVYVCTGDMYPNHAPGKTSFAHLLEREWQERWAEIRRGSIRKKFASPDAPVVCVRGNHDFTSLLPLFDGGPTYELEIGKFVVVAGVSFVGFRGINAMAGVWSDELDDVASRLAVESLASVSGWTKEWCTDNKAVLVSHSPPKGILDEYSSSHFGCASLGMEPLRAFVDDVRPTAHLFGHIHEEGGKTLVRDETLFSNASLTVNELTV